MRPEHFDLATWTNNDSIQQQQHQLSATPRKILLEKYDTYPGVFLHEMCARICGSAATLTAPAAEADADTDTGAGAHKAMLINQVMPRLIKRHQDEIKIYTRNQIMPNAKRAHMKYAIQKQMGHSQQQAVHLDLSAHESYKMATESEQPNILAESSPLTTEFVNDIVLAANLELLTPTQYILRVDGHGHGYAYGDLNEDVVVDMHAHVGVNDDSDGMKPKYLRWLCRKMKYHADGTCGKAAKKYKNMKKKNQVEKNQMNILTNS